MDNRPPWDSVWTVDPGPVAAIVSWLRSLDGPQDPKRLADEIEATQQTSTGNHRGNHDE